MAGRKVIFASLLMLAALLLSSFGTVSFTDGPEDTVKAAPSRAAGENLEIENRTYTVSYLTGSEEWDTVFIWDNATLVIEGATLRAKKVICREDTINTALRIINHEGTQGLLSVTEGIMNVKADSIEVIGSRISVVNGTTTASVGKPGGNSEISLTSKSSDLVITDSELNVRGHDGGLGDSTSYGGRGGEAYLFLGARGANKVQLTDSDFQVEGGAGGSGFVQNSGAGEGGDAFLDVYADTVDIKTSTFFTKGGRAGASGENPGNYGGDSSIEVRSQRDTVIYSTEMEAHVGINSNIDAPKQSFIIIKSVQAKVLWDHDKSDEEKMDTLSHVVADTMNVDTKSGADLHQVDTGESPPQPLGAGSLRMYWWARLTVKDKYGEPIVQSKITYIIAPDPLPYPREPPEIETDEEGKVDIEVIARQGQDWNKFTFQAEDFGGAIGTSDQYRFHENTNREIPIEIVRMTLGVNSPDLKKPLGGEVDFEGYAIPGNSRNIMQNVTLYLDQEVIGYAVDTSEEGAPPFSLWALEKWDTTTVEDGTHELLVIGIDSAYQVRYPITINIDQNAVNHRPELDLVIIGDRTGSFELEPGGHADIHVNQDESLIDFEAEVYEVDMMSTILQFGEGIRVIKATVDVIHVTSQTVILNKVIGEDDIEKINISGGYGFSFEIDANKRPGLDEPYPEGDYRVSFRIEDDGGLESREASVYFTLFFDFFPYIALYIEPDLRPSTDPEFIDESFTVETVDSHVYTALFNFTDSSDRDDDLWDSDPIADRSWSNLRYTVEILDPEGNRATVFGPDAKGAGFTYDFNVKDVKAGEQGIFDIVVTGKDTEDLETTLRLKIRITHNPPPEDEGFFSQKVGLPGEIMAIVSPVLFALLLVSFGLVFSYIQKKNNDDKKKKMDLLERKRKEEEKSKGSSAIEEEFTGGRTTDSREYLKKSGGEKGREDFAKELQAAQDRSANGGQLPEDKPQEPPAAQPKEVKPPQAPSPGQAAPVPQQQPPTPPAPQARAAPPAPPAQAPPTPAPVTQQSPPAPPAPQMPPAAPPPASQTVPPAAPPAPQKPPQPPQQGK
ncbi:MAG: hypothetical protein ACMUHY_02635 [Thermoplasmatota archaeon]